MMRQAALGETGMNSKFVARMLTTASLVAATLLVPLPTPAHAVKDLGGYCIYPSTLLGNINRNRCYIQLVNNEQIVHASRISSLEKSRKDHTARLNEHRSQLKDHLARLANYLARIMALEARAGTAEGRLNDLNSTTSGHGSRLANLEGKVATSAAISEDAIPNVDLTMTPAFVIGIPASTALTVPVSGRVMASASLSLVLDSGQAPQVEAHASCVLEIAHTASPGSMTPMSQPAQVTLPTSTAVPSEPVYAQVALTGSRLKTAGTYLVRATCHLPTGVGSVAYDRGDLDVWTTAL